MNAKLLSIHFSCFYLISPADKNAADNSGNENVLFSVLDPLLSVHFLSDIDFMRCKHEREEKLND